MFVETGEEVDIAVASYIAPEPGVWGLQGTG